MSIKFIKNAPLCDGTPRREKGWRGVFEVKAVRKLYIWSPLMKSKSDVAAYFYGMGRA